MEEEWNTLLDLAKLQAKPEPAIDVSLGSALRTLIGSRKGAYRKLQDDLAAKEQTAKTASAGGGGAADKWREDEVGVCAFSQYGCESCGTCFVSLDLLDRHRLRCLPESAGVLVRSTKAFSGYEGVVESTVGRNKWEAFVIHDRGYGRKRRRVGSVFSSPQEAAAAYAEECRRIFKEEEQQRAEEEKEGSDDDDVEEEEEDAGAARGGHGRLVARRGGGGDAGGAAVGGRAAAEDEYEVERIVDERQVTKRGPEGDVLQSEYLVKWKGYAEQTWEPIAHVETCTVFHAYLRAKLQHLDPPPPPAPAVTNSAPDTPAPPPGAGGGAVAAAVASVG